MSLHRAPLLLLAGLLLASACPGGLKSRVCQQYLERNEQCAAKSGPERAQALRALASLTRTGFEKNQDSARVEESCKRMLEDLENDASCK
jgi:hypothetical protein